MRLIGGPAKEATFAEFKHVYSHDWINKGHVSALKHVLRLSRASGVPIEEFVGQEDEES